MSEFIAGYHGVGIVDKIPYIRLDNLLLKKIRAQVLDIKIGTRSFHESTENNERKTSYVHYVLDLDPTHTFNQHDLVNGITFDEYRQIINDFTTSARLGFRIEGLSLYNANGTCEKLDGDYFKKTVRTNEDIDAFFGTFFMGRRDGYGKVLADLKRLKTALSERKVSTFGYFLFSRTKISTQFKSEWFFQHEMICTSLLIILSDNGNTLKMIDFGKTKKHTNKRINHDRKWTRGTNEDGFLIGLNNLIGAWSGLNISD